MTDKEKKKQEVLSGYVSMVAQQNREVEHRQEGEKDQENKEEREKWRGRAYLFPSLNQFSEGSKYSLVICFVFNLIIAPFKGVSQVIQR